MSNMRRLLLLPLAVLVTNSCIVQATLVLVPSSQFIMTLIPTFSDMTVESLVELQRTMEDVLMHKTQTFHDESSSLHPRDLNVVIQDHVQIRYSSQTAFTEND